MLEKRKAWCKECGSQIETENEAIWIEKLGLKLELNSGKLFYKSYLAQLTIKENIYMSAIMRRNGIKMAVLMALGQNKDCSGPRVCIRRLNVKLFDLTGGKLQIGALLGPRPSSYDVLEIK